MKFAEKLNLHTKIIIALVFILSLGIIFQFFLSSYLLDYKVNKFFEEGMDKKIKEIEGVFYREGVSLLSDAMSLAERPGVQRALKEGDRERLIFHLNSLYKTLKEIKPSLSTLEALDIKGTVVYRAHNPEKYGDDKSGAPLFAKALSTGKPQIGLEVSPTTKKLSIDAIAPVFDGNTLVGLIKAGSYPEEHFLNVLKSLTGLDLAVLYKGEVIGTTLKEFQVEKVSFEKVKTQKIGDKEYLIKKIPLSFQDKTIEDAHLILLANKTQLSKTITLLKVLQLIIGFVILLIMCLCIFFATKIFLNPVRDGTQILEFISKLDLTKELKKYKGFELTKEITMLTNNINSLERALANYVKGIQVASDSINLSAQSIMKDA
ncbi:MAG: cache domain-containing protein, partial [Caldimicrobium sp.]